jgi:hypothetical protein
MPGGCVEVGAPDRVATVAARADWRIVVFDRGAA